MCKTTKSEDPNKVHKDMLEESISLFTLFGQHTSSEKDKNIYIHRLREIRQCFHVI